MCLNFERGWSTGAFVLAALGALACALTQSAAAATPTKYRETVLHSFGGQGDGVNPESPVIAVKGVLYGTTFISDDDSLGKVYSLDPKTGQETVLLSLYDETLGALLDVHGTLYGTTAGDDSWGAAYSFDLATNSVEHVYLFCSRGDCLDGAAPRAGLIELDGLLYGTTIIGGSGYHDTGCAGDYACGTVFSLDPDLQTERVIYSFCSQLGCTDGSVPQAELLAVNGVLYGTTTMGGTAACSRVGSKGCGTVFSVDPVTGAQKTVHAFCVQQDCPDGAIPSGGLVELNGRLYGTTYWGGDPAFCGVCGTVYSIDPALGVEKVVHSFHGGADGSHPAAALIAVKGTLYGTTQDGGRHSGLGTVFSIDPATGVEKILHTFHGGADGAHPVARLLELKGTLYGTTAYGGGVGCGVGCGTVFSLAR
jgi:uncharacterized repeat protein (TIGR03803 family)